ncbi:hypothetical protein [Luteolibacter soli]
MRLLPLLALALSASSAFADGRKVSFRTLCLDYSGSVNEVVLPAAKAGEAATTLPLYTSGPSPVIEATFATTDAVLYIKGDPTKPVIAAKAPLAKSDRQLFVLTPGPEGEGKPPYIMRAYDDDLTTFKLGSVRAINLAAVPVRFVISGTTTPQIPTDKHAIFPQSTKVDEYNMYPVAVEFLSGNGSWVKGYSASWKASDQRREIVVTLIDPRFKQPSVKYFNDSPQWLEKPPGATP